MEKICVDEIFELKIKINSEEDEKKKILKEKLKKMKKKWII